MEACSCTNRKCLVSPAFVCSTMQPDLYAQEVFNKRRKSASGGMPDAQSFLPALLNCIQNAVIVCSTEGTMEHWNPAAETLFEYQSSEVIGRSVSLVLPGVLPDDLSPGPAGMSVAQRRTLNFGLTTRRGRKKHAAVNMFPMRDSEERIVGWAMIVSDSTELLQARETMREKAGKPNLDMFGSLLPGFSKIQESWLRRTRKQKSLLSCTADRRARAG